MTAAQAAVYVARPMTSYRLLSVGAGAREIGVATAAFALLPLFLAIPLGRLADRRHDRSLLVGGCAIQVAGCLLLASATTTLGLSAASALLGLGHLGLALGVQSVIARESDPSRHDQHFGLFTAGVSLGQLIGPLLGGLLVGDAAGRALTAATGHAMLAAAGLAALALVCAAFAERGHASTPPARPPAASTAGVLGILSTRGVPAAIFASTAVLSSADVFTAYLPLLGDERGISPRVVGMLLAVRAATSMASRVGIGAIVSRVGRVRLIMISACISAVALGSVTLVENVAALAALSALTGFGLGFGQPLSMTLVVQQVPERARATALAVRLTGNRLGQVAAPAIAGLVAGSTGPGAVFWLLSGMLLASAVAIRRPPLDGRPAAGDAALE